MEIIYIIFSNIVLCVWNVCGGGIMFSVEVKIVNIFFLESLFRMLVYGIIDRLNVFVF